MSEAAKTNTFQVLDFIDVKRLKDDVSFSNVDLDGAFMGQASLFSHYGVLHASASFQVDQLKLLVETTESAIYKAIRDEFVKRGEKPTEAQLDKLVSSHESVRSAKIALNKAKRIEAIGKSATEAFRHRRDMLMQAGFAAREERKGEMRLHEQAMTDERRLQMQKEVAASMKST